jgi:diguanylate cyclase (GGDEF)-like protein
MTASPRMRIVLAVAALLWLTHVGVVAALGTGTVGPLLSDTLQLVLGGVVIYSAVEASRCSEGLARSFWRLSTVAYFLWFVAQGLSVYNDFSPSQTVAWMSNLLFCFWFVPLAMALVLDPERESGGLDTLIALDLAQAVLVCVVAYLYFFYLPIKETSGELAHEVWTPYFAGYGLVAVAFMLRAATSRSRDARFLFGRIGIFLAVSGCVDALYYYGPGRALHTGAWFDLLWSGLLIFPIAVASAWKQAELPEFNPAERRREKPIYSEIFYLLYPLLVMFMSLRIARERLGLAALVVLLAFVCSSARLLITQHRMLLVKDELRREAAHDSLTGLWNHKSILEILDRELLRAERDAQPVGLIMADVDHFKTINDSRGHAAGDAVLRIIASSMAAVVRPYDAVGRYGGEEFIIVAPGCALAETWELAERVRSHVAACNIVIGGEKVQVSMSLGVATGQSASDSQKLLRAADKALYQAKNAGRNRVEPCISRAAGAGSGPSPAPAPNSDFWI